MLVLANSTLRDTIYGMVYRVGIGAFLSTIDAATDIYVITTYYKTPSLVYQGNMLLAMIVTNAVVQLSCVVSQYKEKSWKEKLREALISMFFLRPAVDAYRVSTNRDDKEANFDNLSEMMINKVCTQSDSKGARQWWVTLRSVE